MKHIILGAECIKNYYRVLAVDLTEQKELDADPEEVSSINRVWWTIKIPTDSERDYNFVEEA